MLPSLHHRPLLLALAIGAAAVVVAPTGASAQDVFDAKTAAHVRDAYVADLDTLHAKVMALANAIPADKYAWRPTKEVRTISEVFMHVAAEWYFWTPRSVGGNAPPELTRPKLDSLEKKFTAKTDVIDQLDKSWTHARRELTTVDPAKLTGKYKPFGVAIDQAALIMTDDLHEHLGQLIVYARSVGVKPPWSK